MAIAPKTLCIHCCLWKIMFGLSTFHHGRGYYNVTYFCGIATDIVFLWLNNLAPRLPEVTPIKHSGLYTKWWLLENNGVKERRRVRVSIAVSINQYNGNFKRKGFAWLPYHSPLRKVKTGTQTKQGTGDRTWCIGHGGMLLTGLLPMPCSVCFLTESRTTSLEKSWPTVDWALSHPPLIDEMPYSCFVGR